MAYIPKDAQWFLAQHVEEIRVQGHKRNIVHINYVLIRARTPKDAYQKALILGKRGNAKYKNPEGKNVTVRFLGLRDLDVIPFPLEHGCEIMFTERLGVTEAGIRRLVRKKSELEAFLPIRERPGRPNYASRAVMDEFAREMAGRKDRKQRR
jgi:hypothetical protein